VLSLGGWNGVRHGFFGLALDAVLQRIRTKAKKRNGRRELIAPRLPYFPGGSGGSRQIDSFNSFEARKATFLLALI
jgi:hypothetical protein